MPASESAGAAGWVCGFGLAFFLAREPDAFWD
jgi:hypothetical protein